MIEVSERQAQAVFDRFKSEKFSPANEAYRDDTRIALDEAVLCDVLGLCANDDDKDAIKASLEVLRQQWCREPTVHGGKKTRPQQVHASSAPAAS